MGHHASELKGITQLTVLTFVDLEADTQKNLMTYPEPKPEHISVGPISLSFGFFHPLQKNLLICVRLKRIPETQGTLV